MAGPARYSKSAARFRCFRCRLTVNGARWGSLGFDDCRSERLWDAMEIDLLETATALIAGAIERALADERLRERDNQLVEAQRIGHVGSWEPVLDGPGFYRALQRERPDLVERFAFITGDTLSAEVQAFLNHTDVPYLEKPFRPNDVLRLLSPARARQEATGGQPSGRKRKAG